MCVVYMCMQECAYADMDIPFLKGKYIYWQKSHPCLPT